MAICATTWEDLVWEYSQPEDSSLEGQWQQYDDFIWVLSSHFASIYTWTGTWTNTAP